MPAAAQARLADCVVQQAKRLAEKISYETLLPLGFSIFVSAMLFRQRRLTFVAYRIHVDMNAIYETEQFSDWVEKLHNLKAKMRILARVNRARAGNFGEYKVLGDGICEMKIDYGPGYRVYYAQEGLNVYLLILGGDKSSQNRDIAKAKEMWCTILEERQ